MDVPRERQAEAYVPVLQQGEPPGASPSDSFPDPAPPPAPPATSGPPGRRPRLLPVAVGPEEEADLLEGKELEAQRPAVVPAALPPRWSPVVEVALERKGCSETEPGVVLLGGRVPR